MNLRKLKIVIAIPMGFIRSLLFPPHPLVSGSVAIVSRTHFIETDIGNQAVDPLTPRILTAFTLASAKLGVENPESVAHTSSVYLPYMAPTALT